MIRDRNGRLQFEPDELEGIVRQSTNQDGSANLKKATQLVEQARAEFVRRENMSAKRTKVDVVDVVRHGEAMIIPPSMSLEDALRTIQYKIREEETYGDFSADIEASPADGAYALSRAMEQQFGVAIAKPRAGFLSFDPPKRITVEIDADGNTMQVPWGDFALPGIDGTISTSATASNGVLIFQIRAEIKQKHKDAFDRLVALTKELVRTSSIYRGKAIRVHFPEAEQGRFGPQVQPPDIKFMKVSEAVRPIFSRDLEDQFDNDVLYYIENPTRARQLHGGVLKRGVMLAGPYGTGKTLSANYIARVAEQHGFTFIYTKAKEVALALDFARTYLPAVVFAEDIDEVISVGRDEQVNNLLNKLDGVDSKRHDIITVFTTNHHERITPALLRPGRIDVLMVVDPPDAEAAVRIADFYAGGLLDPNDDFSEAGKIMAKARMIPATIQEVVKRSLVRADRRTGGVDMAITNADLKGGALSVQRERDLITQTDEKVDPVVQLGTSMGAALGRTLEEAAMHLSDRVFSATRGNLLLEPGDVPSVIEVANEAVSHNHRERTEA